MIRSFTAVAAVLTVPAFAGQPCAPTWDIQLGDANTNALIAHVESYDAGSGAELYATGSFVNIDGVAASRIARWDGAQWNPLGTGLAGNFSNELEVFNGDLYVAGYFNSAGGAAGSAKIARWDGSQWFGLDAQLDLFTNSLWALKTWDDGTGDALYVGGNYVDAGGAGGPDFIAKWDGAAFSPVGGTIAGAGIPLIVLDIEVFQGELYIAGRFASVGGVAASHIAKWDGSTWSPVGSGITGTQVIQLGVADDGNGEALYAGGNFTQAGGVPAANIAKWDGSTWSALGSGTTSTVQAIAGFDDGNGPKVYVGGSFTGAGGQTVNGIATWNGSAWAPVGSGVGDIANESVFDLFPNGDRLTVSGSFQSIDGQPAIGRIAQYIACEAGNPADFNGDGVVDGVDLAALLANWGMPGFTDLNDDGTTDGADLASLLANWTP